MHRVVSSKGIQHSQTVLPLSMRKTVLRDLHAVVGHQGIEKTFSVIQTKCYWPSMCTDVQAYCKGCKLSILSKRRNFNGTVYWQHFTASEPMEIIAYDWPRRRPERLAPEVPQSTVAAVDIPEPELPLKSSRVGRGETIKSIQVAQIINAASAGH